MKKSFTYIGIFVGLILLYMLLLTVVSAIPKDAIKIKTEKTSQELLTHWEKTRIKYLGKNIILFNFTDALMVNTAYSIDSQKPLFSAMTAKRNYIPGVTTKTYKDTKPKGMESDGESAEYQESTFQTEELAKTVRGEDIPAIEYGRYWHGYLVFLRPLLMLFSYNTIRVLSAVAFTILTLILCYLLYKKVNIFAALVFAISLISVDVFIASISLNAITPFFIAVIVSIILVWKFEKVKDNYEIFLISGSTTAFLDLLTTPLVTIGIPITIYFLMLQKREQYKFKDIAVRYLKVCTAWGIGYAGTMVAKWVIIDLLYNREVVITSIQEFTYRVGSVPISYVFAYNYAYFEMTGVMTAILPMAIITMIIAKIKFKEKNVVNILPYIVTAFMPIVWFMLLKNHSYIHSFFTYRNIVITIFNIEIIVITLVINLIYKKMEEIK